MKSKSGGPDGLEAWCVALSACFINFVMAGLGRMSGILFVAFIDIFNVNRLEASVPLSVRSLMRNLLGPVVGILGQKYGVRTTTLIGGILGTLSATFCFYAQNMLWITILWGAINGAGAALSTTLPQVVLAQHFKKYRSTASGMSFSGCCVGSFLFPALLECLLKTYGVGGSFLILSGIIMNVIPAAMMLRKPSWLKNGTKRSIQISAKEKYETCHSDAENFDNKLDNNDMKCFQKKEKALEENLNSQHHTIQMNKYFAECDNTKFTKINTKVLRENNHLVTKLLKNITTNTKDGDDYRFVDVSENTLHTCLEDLYTFIDSIFKENYSLSDIFIKDSFKLSDSSSDNKVIQKNYKIENSEVLLSAGKLKACSNLEFYNYFSSKVNKLTKDGLQNTSILFTKEESITLNLLMEQLKCLVIVLDAIKNYSSVITNQNTKQNSSVDDADKQANTFKTHIKTALMLHKNPLFLLISFSRSVHFLTFVPVITILVDFSMDKGLLEEDGKYVIAAISFGDLIGRLCLGWVTDKEYLSLPRYMLVVMVMQGACTVAMSLMASKLTLLSVTTVFGLLQGSLFVRHPVLVTKYLKSNEQSVAIGCINFFSGLLGFALPNYIGYFRDTIGSYDYIFYINGSIGSLVGMMWFFERYLVKWTSSSQEPVREHL